MAYYVGIDIGTSSAKLTLIDENGTLLKEASAGYRFEEPAPGYKEIDPATWMKAVDRAMTELFSEKDPALVKGIGVTGQMHTLVLLDEAGESIRPALMWNDTRTADMVGTVKEQIRKLPSVSYIANIISTGSPAMNLLWVKEQEPEAYSRIHKFLIGPDYIVYRLTGSLQTDYCEASTSSLLDMNKKEWSGEIRQLFGFSPTIYPTIRGTNEIAGRILPEVAERYGFSEEVGVLVGTGDNPAAAISTGCFQEKKPVISLGTSGVLMYPREAIDFEAKGKNILFSFDGNETQILVQGVVQSCGSSMTWWMRDILDTDNYEKETNMDPAHLGESNLLFFPHLTGDKTIYADPKLSGAFLGLRTETSRRDMTIAVMEGIAYGFRQLTEVMKISKEQLKDLRITGGGSKNPVWMQIFADVLNCSVCQFEAGAGAGYSMALCAAGVFGGASLERMISRTVKVKACYQPREYNAKRYDENYQKYLRIYKALTYIN